MAALREDDLLVELGELRSRSAVSLTVSEYDCSPRAGEVPIFLTVLAASLLGNTLRDALDPTLT